MPILYMRMSSSLEVPGMTGVPWILAIRTWILPVLALFHISWKAVGIYFSLIRLEHRENILQEEFETEKYFSASL